MRRTIFRTRGPEFQCLEVYGQTPNVLKDKARISMFGSISSDFQWF